MPNPYLFERSAYNYPKDGKIYSSRVRVYIRLELENFSQISMIPNACRTKENENLRSLK